MVASTHSEIPRSALANGAENRNREEPHPSPDETPSQQVPDSVCRPRPQAPCVRVLHRGSPCAKARSPSTNFPEFGARRSRKPSHRPKHVSPKLPSPAIHLPDRFLQSPQQSSTLSIGRIRSEEHTSELQSQSNLVCRLLLEKKKEK